MLVVLVFMHVRYEHQKIVWIVLLAGIFGWDCCLPLV